MYYSTVYLSPLGKITLACDACGKNLVGLWLEGQKYYQGTLKEALIEKDSVPLFDIVKKWLDRYFSGQKPDAAERRWHHKVMRFARAFGKFYVRSPMER